MAKRGLPMLALVEIHKEMIWLLHKGAARRTFATGGLFFCRGEAYLCPHSGTVVHQPKGARHLPGGHRHFGF
jgi:hypothetical protein